MVETPLVAASSADAGELEMSPGPDEAMAAVDDVRANYAQL